MVMELVVLAAAELGLGTCWLGGFGEQAVKEVLGLDETTRVVAISPLGRPPEKISAAWWDYMLSNLISKRRVDPGKIVSVVKDSMIIPEIISRIKEPVRFDGRPVDQGTIMSILEAARLAPSANNSQIWRFFIIRDDVTLRQAALLAGAARLFERPHDHRSLREPVDRRHKGDRNSRFS